MSDRNEPAYFVCRCEEVTVEEIEQAVEAGARTINDVKRRTRAGMGLCQGVYCLEQVATTVAALRETPREVVVPMTVRPPARAIRLDALAGLGEGD